MSLNKIVGVQKWNLDSLPQDALADVSIHFTYPALDTLLHLEPKQRIGQVDSIMRQNIELVVAQCLPTSFVPYGRRHARSMRCSLPLSRLSILCDMEQVRQVVINKIAGVKQAKLRTRKPKQFFCVRMTVAIQIEGQQSGLQDYEDRFILIKATSSEDAYTQVKATSSSYGEPYLNSDGNLVRWKIESLDDCYETGISRLSEFNKPEGAEVFSVLKRRRITPDRTWDGTPD